MISQFIEMNFNLLERPHPFIYTRMSVLLPGAVVFILMFVLSPFGLHNLTLSFRFMYAFMFGLIGTLGVALTVTLLRLTAPRFMKEEKWTIGKESILTVLVIFTISILVYSFFMLLGFIPSNKINFLLDIVLKTIGISIIPITLLIIYEQFTHQKKKLKQARRLTFQLRKQFGSLPQPISPSEEIHSNTDGSSAKILLEAENGNIELQVNPQTLVYLKSDGNYVEIYYINSDGFLKKKLIRNRLKKLSDHLPDDSFFRCHKSYIVNRNHIISVNGNARNFELFLTHSDDPIPVSRSKSHDLKQFLRYR